MVRRGARRATRRRYRSKGFREARDVYAGAPPGRIVALEHDYDDYDARSYRGSPRFAPTALIGLSHTQVPGYYTNRSEALYGQVDYSLDDLVKGLSVTAGLRQSWDSVKGCVGSATYSQFGQAFYTATPSARTGRARP